MKPDIGILEKNAQIISDRLNLLLADETLLYIKTRNFHWNIEGISFNDLHKFFENQYKELEIFIDDIAERSRILGFYAIGSLQEYLKIARIKECLPPVLKAQEMLLDLLKSHESIIKFIRQDIQTAQELKDEGSANFLTDLLESHEKMTWMLRSFLS
jgi:starvation-inducible DNA-binding protein